MKQDWTYMWIDFVISHISMIAAIGITSFGYSLFVSGPDQMNSSKALLRFYSVFLCIGSFIFPLVFFSCGFYKRPRPVWKFATAVTMCRGTGIALGMYLLTNFFLFRDILAPRSVLLVFSFFLVSGLLGARSVVNLVAWHFDVHPKTRAGLALLPGFVLVVGGAGYIGSILVRRLLQEGFRVRVLDKFIYGRKPLEELKNHPNLELIHGDCRDMQTVIEAVRGTQAIIHLAAIVGDPACDQDHENALEVNESATRMLIEIAKGQRVRRFILASSCSVYGASDEEVDELSDCRPVSLYAQTKINSENAAIEAQTDSFQPVVLRFATVFGYSFRPRFDLVVNLLVARACQDQKITIFNPEQWRPFIHVSDIAEGLITALKAPASVVAGQVFNIGDQRLNYTLGGIAELVEEAFPGLEVEHIRNADRRNYRVSFRKAEEALGFRCRIDIRQGIAELRSALMNGEVQNYMDSIYNNQRFLLSNQFVDADERSKRVMAAFGDLKITKSAAA